MIAKEGMDRCGQFPTSLSRSGGRIKKKPYARKHTGWAVAVGRKHAEKIGVPISSKFFETRRQDPVMIMNRPLFPRPSTPPKGGDIVSFQYDSNGTLVPVPPLPQKEKQRLEEATCATVGSTDGTEKRKGLYQFKSASERVAYDDHNYPFYRSASERVALVDRGRLDERSASERVVYDDDV